MKYLSWKKIIPILLGIVIVLSPIPSGLNQTAWYFFAIFMTVIVGLILEPIPAAAIGFTGIFTVAALGLISSKPIENIRWALSGFSNTTVWLIFGAFMFALGYEKTGLGKRIALIFVKFLGGKTLGLGYAITLADFVLSPFTPSNTARSAGTIFPIIKNLPPLYGSTPGKTARKIGSYIMWTALSATCITSSMFVTAFAPNLLALDLVNKTTSLHFSWTEWTIGFLPVGCILLFSLPYLIYKIYPPEIKTSKEVPIWAMNELKKMGKLTIQEIIMFILALLALVLWIFGSNLFDSATVAGIVISLMIITGIVTWDDIISNKQAWNVLIWFATLVALTDGLNKVGFVLWFAQSTVSLMTGMVPTIIMIMLVLVFFLIHYMFASVTAHAIAILPVMLALGTAIPDFPIKIFCLLLCYSLGIMGIITPYAAGPSPVYFGSGYINRKDFWLLGAVFGTIFLFSLLGIGYPYLLLLSSL